MKKKEKEKAILLRKNGVSIRNIAKTIGVSKSSVSMWVRNVEMSKIQKELLSQEKEINDDILKTISLKVDNEREIAKEFGVSQSCIRNKMKKLGIKTSRGNRLSVFLDKCEICNKKTENKNICSSCRTKIRRIRTKWKAIKYLGCKCKNCDKVATVETMPCFEFHHYNSDKDFNIGNVSNKAWNSIEIELKKCHLLCSNCHRIKHSDRDKIVIDYAMNKYNGKS